MLRVVIVDDEPLARQKLRQLLAEQPEATVVAEAASVKEALEKVRAENPDVIFLDVHMPESDGFALLKELENPPQVVFVTAYSDYAVEAFACDAVDYLVKPVRAVRLTQTMARLQARTENMPAWQSGDRICFRTPERTLIARPEAVIALEADGDFTRVHVEGEAPLMICHKLGHYEQTLPSPPFLRLDRSLMINVDHVKRIEQIDTEHAKLHLTGLENPFLLGRTARRRLASVISD